MNGQGIVVIAHTQRRNAVYQKPTFCFYLSTILLPDMSKWSDREQNFFDDIKRNLSKSQQTYYTDVYFKKVIERFQERAKSASQDLSPVYLAVDDALLSQTPKARYNVGQGCSLMMALMNCLPSSLLDVILTESPNTYLEKDIEPPVNMKFE